MCWLLRLKLPSVKMEICVVGCQGGKVDDTWRIDNWDPNREISKTSHSLIKKEPDCSRSFWWLESRPGFWKATRRRWWWRGSSVMEFHFPFVFSARYGGRISWKLPSLLSATKWVKNEKRNTWWKEKRVQECRTRQMAFFFQFFFWWRQAVWPVKNASSTALLHVSVSLFSFE